MQQEGTHSNMNSLAGTVFVVILSAVVGPLVELLNGLDRVTEGITGPQATLLVFLGGALLQVGFRVSRSVGRRRRVRRRRALGVSDFTREPNR